MPFLRMLLAVVSLKCKRPTVTFVTCSGGRLTLQGKGKVLRGRDGGCGGPGQRAGPRSERWTLWVPTWLPPISSQANSRVSPPRYHPYKGQTLT